MHVKWLIKRWSHLFWLIVVNSLIVCSTTEHRAHSGEAAPAAAAAIAAPADSDNNPKFSISNELVPERSRRATVIHAATTRLIDERQCSEIRNLCSNLRDGSDDLPVLECVQTFLSNQIENLSDECQHAIWTHTGK